MAQIDREVLVRLLHQVDGTLGLVVHRGEGPQDPTWKAEAESLKNQCRMMARSIDVGAAVGLDEHAIRRDERCRLALLLEAHGDTLTKFTNDDSSTLKLIVYMLRLDGEDT